MYNITSKTDNYGVLVSFSFSFFTDAEEKKILIYTSKRKHASYGFAGRFVNIAKKEGWSVTVRTVSLPRYKVIKVTRVISGNAYH